MSRPPKMSPVLVDNKGQIWVYDSALEMYINQTTGKKISRSLAGYYFRTGRFRATPDSPNQAAISLRKAATLPITPANVSKAVSFLNGRYGAPIFSFGYRSGGIAVLMDKRLASQRGATLSILKKFLGRLFGVDHVSPIKNGYLLTTVSDTELKHAIIESQQQSDLSQHMLPPSLQPKPPQVQVQTQTQTAQTQPTQVQVQQTTQALHQTVNSPPQQIQPQQPQKPTNAIQFFVNSVLPPRKEG